MGFYIDGPSMGKVGHIASEHGGEVVSYDQAVDAMLHEPDKAVICVVDNHAFEAAGFCFDLFEFNAFADPKDRRRKTWMVMDRARACALSGYVPPTQGRRSIHEEIHSR